MQVLLGKLACSSDANYQILTKLFCDEVVVTAIIQVLLWWDKKKATAAVEERISSSPSPSVTSDDPVVSTSDVDERQTVTADKISPV